MKVEYLTLPGWNTNTEEVRNFKELPENAQAYVYKIQELLGVPGNESSSISCTLLKVNGYTSKGSDFDIFILPAF